MFRVSWVPQARRELARIWGAADSAQRRQITSATHLIDTKLTRDPYHFSESRPAGRRILFQFPLGIVIRIDDAQQRVRVLQVWRIS